MSQNLCRNSVADKTLFCQFSLGKLSEIMRFRHFYMHRQHRRVIFLFWVILEFVLSSGGNFATSRRLWWVYPMNQQRGNRPRGEFHSHVQELQCFPDHFYQYFCMSIEKFDELLAMVKGRISKENTNWRGSIMAEERLAVCLR